MSDGVSHTSRRRLLGTAGTVLLAGCTGVTSSLAGGDKQPDSGSTDSLPVREPDRPLAFSLDEYEGSAADSPAGKDSIPSIDDPEIADAAGTTMFDEDVVFGVELGGEARAYPQRVVVHHEIVNDTLAGVPISVTYCPLTGTAVGYRRGEVTFGVEGWLINSNLILYDRETGSWWPQVLGTAVSGPFEGYALEGFRVVWTTWGRWRSTHPETTALTDETGYARDYRGDPYGTYNPDTGYYHSSRIAYPVMNEDDRLDPKDVVVGARTPDGAAAFGKDRLRGERVLEATLGGTPYLGVYDPALDTGFVYRNPDERSLTVDGDQYGLGGDSYGAGDLPLATVNAFDSMWFAWVAFYPETALLSTS